MDKKEITIDINKLDSDELEKLAELLYRYGYMEECRDVNRRKIFIEN